MPAGSFAAGFTRECHSHADSRSSGGGGGGGSGGGGSGGGGGGGESMWKMMSGAPPLTVLYEILYLPKMSSNAIIMTGLPVPL